MSIAPRERLRRSYSGVRQTFQYLLVLFLIVLPPLTFAYLRQMRNLELYR